jgi:2-keto-3-deoxy-6-phosphogluconate aldolase
MNFFKQKWVKVTAWTILFADLVVLFLGGVTQKEVSDGVALGFIAIGAIAAIVAFIAERTKAKELPQK